MHCHICDRLLSDAEIILNRDSGEYEPCSTCLEVIYDAAYSGGFSPDGQPLDLPEDVGTGAVPTLEPEYDEEVTPPCDVAYHGDDE